MSAALVRQVRAFTGRVTNNVALPCRTRFVKVCATIRNKQSSTTADLDAGHSVFNLPIAVSVALTTLGLTAQNAFAEDTATLATGTAASALSPEDLQVLAANSSGSAVEEVVVSVLFGVVVVLLAIVSGGVLYINIKQWLDGRQEQEDREKGVKDLEPLPSGASKAKGADEDDVVVPLRRANRIKKEKGKGFASTELTSRR